MTMMKDDLIFFREVKELLKSIPERDYGQLAFDTVLSEWNELEARQGRDTSSRLQDKCRVLFILAHLKKD